MGVPECCVCRSFLFTRVKYCKMCHECKVQLGTPDMEPVGFVVMLPCMSCHCYGVHRVNTVPSFVVELLVSNLGTHRRLLGLNSCLRPRRKIRIYSHPFRYPYAMCMNVYVGYVTLRFIQCYEVEFLSYRDSGSVL
jgi:hypothetical protein